MEVQNVRSAVQPFLRPGVKVLDLACGTGFYTLKLLQWESSASVSAADISRPVIGKACSRMQEHTPGSEVRFVEADGAEPQSLSPDGSLGYFDLAFGAWFLNYAQSKAMLTAMFENIARNIKPGGVFVGVVPPPTENLHERAEACSRRPLNQVFPRNEYTEELESADAWGLHVYLNDTRVDFMTWHLRRLVYEEAARAAGLQGRLEWRREVLLGEEWRASYALSVEEWRVREANPHFGTLIVEAVRQRGLLRSTYTGKSRDWR